MVKKVDFYLPERNGEERLRAELGEKRGR